MIVALVLLPSCAPVRHLESISAYDGAMQSLFRIDAVGDEARIMTRSSFHEPFTTRTYPFSKQERDDISLILSQNGFLELKDHYKPMFKTVHDGETLTVRIEYDGRNKSVFCNNKIPWRMRRICAQIIRYYAAKTPNKNP